jgi:hypothetical protein
VAETRVGQYKIAYSKISSSENSGLLFILTLLAQAVPRTFRLQSDRFFSGPGGAIRLDAVDPEMICGM